MVPGNRFDHAESCGEKNWSISIPSMFAYTRCYLNLLLSDWWEPFNQVVWQTWLLQFSYIIKSPYICTCSNIPESPAYGVYISQLYKICQLELVLRVVILLIEGGYSLTSLLSDQGYTLENLLSKVAWYFYVQWSIYSITILPLLCF